MQFTMRAFDFKVKAVLSISVLAVAITGCSNFNDGSLDYLHARSNPTLKMPDDIKTPAFYEFMEIPKTATASSDLNVKNSSGKQYVLPKPIALNKVDLKETPVGLGKPSKPIFATDGNGYPVLQVEGEGNMVWEQLNTALKNANIKVNDINQSLGQISVQYQNVTKQVYAHSTQFATTITVQDSANALSDKTVAQTLLSALLKNWPS